MNDTRTVEHEISEEQRIHDEQHEIVEAMVDLLSWRRGEDVSLQTINDALANTIATLLDWHSQFVVQVTGDSSPESQGGN